MLGSSRRLDQSKPTNMMSIPFSNVNGKWSLVSRWQPDHFFRRFPDMRNGCILGFMDCRLRIFVEFEISPFIDFDNGISEQCFDWDQAKGAWGVFEFRIAKGCSFRITYRPFLVTYIRILWRRITWLRMNDSVECGLLMIMAMFLSENDIEVLDQFDQV